jgi:cytosine/adenosine deaminase-related metal-dependent hydrolase
MPAVTVSDILTGPAMVRRADAQIAWDGDTITAIGAADAAPDRRLLVLPAFANAHDHARPLAMSSFGAAFMPLETWLLRSALATPPDPYLAACAPLARAAQSGCAAVMVHYTRPSGTRSLVDEASEVARAAGDVGVRIAFALALRDRNPLVYCNETGLMAALPAEARATVDAAYRQQPRSVAEMIETSDAIAAAIEGPMVSVQYGPAGVQWCSNELLEAVAERSAATGRRVHMHLLETRYHRAWADEAFPAGIVSHLKDIGLLSQRLSLAHCILATPAELELIAEAGATIVTNTSSNLHLRSGIAPIPTALASGCDVAVGMDGLAFDEDDDMLREMRLTHAVHAGLGFEPTYDRREFLAATIAAGRRAIGAPGSGALEPGAPADFIAIDLDRLDRDAIMPVDPVDLLFARGTAAYLERLVVAGRTIVADGRATGIDLPAVENELRERYRSGRDRFDGLEAAWPQLENAIQHWFAGRGAACC